MLDKGEIARVKEGGFTREAARAKWARTILRVALDPFLSRVVAVESSHVTTRLVAQQLAVSPSIPVSTHNKINGPWYTHARARTALTRGAMQK